MGFLLDFMFLWNMLGALIVLPALDHSMLTPALEAATAQPASPPVAASHPCEGERLSRGQAGYIAAQESAT